MKIHLNVSIWYVFLFLNCSPRLRFLLLHFFSPMYPPTTTHILYPSTWVPLEPAVPCWFFLVPCVNSDWWDLDITLRILPLTYVTREIKEHIDTIWTETAGLCDGKMRKCIFLAESFWFLVGNGPSRHITAIISDSLLLLTGFTK